MEGTLSELTEGHEYWHIRYQGEAPSLHDFELNISHEDGDIRITDVSANEIQPVIDRLRTNGCIIQTVHEQRESLEDLFMRALVAAESDDASTPGAVRGKHK